MKVYAVSIRVALRTEKDKTVHTHLALAASEAGAIALAQGETPGELVSCSVLGDEADLKPKPDVTLEIAGQTFTYKQPGLLASAPPGTRLLGRDG